MVTLRAFSTPAEAALAKSLLDDHGIAKEKKGQSLGLKPHSSAIISQAPDVSVGLASFVSIVRTASPLGAQKP